MNNTTKNQQTDVKENVVAGIVGAFLFSLVGGVLWFLIYMFGFIAGISGLIGAVCAIKGYSIFAKKESIKGIIISVIISLLVIALAWYFCLAYDVYDVYNEWFEAGEIDFSISFFDAVRGAHIFLTDPEIGPAYFGDLAIGIILCIVGAGSYVINKIRSAKNGVKNTPEPTPIQAQEQEDTEKPTEEESQETAQESTEEKVFH